MNDNKAAVMAQVEEYGAATNEPQAVVAASKTLSDFEARQHALTRMQAIKEEIKPLIWCKLCRTALVNLPDSFLGTYMFFICILWGYDGLAGGVVVSITQFRQHFGSLFEGDYVVDANWQLGFNAATLFGMRSSSLTNATMPDFIYRARIRWFRLWSDCQSLGPSTDHGRCILHQRLWRGSAVYFDHASPILRR